MPSKTKDDGRILIVPDTHAPYQDQRAWDLMIKVAKDFAPDIVLHQGDLADFYSVSFHGRDPARKEHLPEEVQESIRLKNELEALQANRYIFVEGNHEFRLRRYIEKQAPALYDMPGSTAQEMLDLGNWEYVPYRTSIQVGGVWYTHDTGHSGKYTTARAIETYQDSAVIAHHHSMAYIVQGFADGGRKFGAQLGWLGDPDKADYMHEAKRTRQWSQGFGIGHIVDGQTYLQPIPILDDYSCHANGWFYRG